MKKKIDISVVILSFNEGKSIIRTLESVKNNFDEIIILDSNSNDETIKICRKYTKKIFYRKFDNFCNQRNFAITDIPTKNDYLFFLDSDEIVTQELINEIENLNLYQYHSYFVKRKFIWYGCWMKYGGYYPLSLMRIGNKKLIRYKGIVNEHMYLTKGNTKYLQSHIIDYFDKPFRTWVIKHINYSNLESVKHFENNQNESKNLKIWKKLPLLIRPSLLFIYRLIIKKGFLMGFKGIVYIFLHTIVYRTYIDLLIIKKYLFKSMNK